jgi:SAM-dependent methyltransferase
MPPTPKPGSAEYFDGWYAAKAATPTVSEVMNRHMGLPADLKAGAVAAEAIPEIIGRLRLKPGGTLVDLACGRGAYGLLIARATQARLIGVDFSAQAITEAREQATTLGVDHAEFQVGDLTRSGLPDGIADAVLCTDSIQFPDEPAQAYAEIRRVVKSAGRIALTCWEPTGRDDGRLSARMRRADLAAGLEHAGFTEIEWDERPRWLERERAMWEEAVAIDPGDDPALRSFHDEGVRSLAQWGLLRRVLATATAP